MLYTVRTVLASLAEANADKVPILEAVRVVPNDCKGLWVMEGGLVSLPPTQLLVCMLPSSSLPSKSSAWNLSLSFFNLS